jgi:8-hydroxy-5-deazaflavin:NADPH oxidoreductase
MKIAVLGAGNIGGTIGTKWAKAGHMVRFGVRDPGKAEVQDLIKSLGENASATSTVDAIAFGDVVLFAIPGQSMDETITANAKVLDGKILIDAANNMRGAATDSMSVFAAKTPNAKVYRAFNIYGWENFEETEFGGVRGDLFYCGPDGEPRAIMEKLIADVGLEPMYVGGPDQVGVVDGILRLWFALANGQKKGRHLTFKVLTR